MSTSALRHTYLQALLSGNGIAVARAALLFNHALSVRPVLALPYSVNL